MLEQKHRSDIIGKCKLNKIENRLNDIISNGEEAPYCFRALIESYFDIAEYTGVAIKYYCKTGYSTLDMEYGYNDICEFDEYAKKSYDYTQKIRKIINIKYASIMQVEEIANLIEQMDEKVARNEFSTPKDFVQNEYKRNLLTDVVSTYVQIHLEQNANNLYKYDDEEKYNLLIDMYEAYTEEPGMTFYRDGRKPQFEQEIAGILRLITNKSKFRGKVFEKKK